MRNRYVRFGLVIVVIVVCLGYLAYTGVQESKSYYVTIKELKADKDPYHQRLRVAGTVLPGSIKRTGSHVEFTLQEEDRTLPVVYNGSEAPPDTFHDSSQALAEGTYGRDGVFHAKQLQAKCASKYAPQQQQQAPAAPSPATTQTSQAAPAGMGAN